MNATSKAIFKVSRSGTPSKKERHKGKVTADKLNVRSWAGRDSPTVSFSPLCIKDVVSVCDAVTLPIVATIRQGCCCDSADNLTCVLLEGAGVVNNISTRVIKE